jgi:hypothetical protein
MPKPTIINRKKLIFWLSVLSLVAFPFPAYSVMLELFSGHPEWESFLHLSGLTSWSGTIAYGFLYSKSTDSSILKPFGQFILMLYVVQGLLMIFSPPEKLWIVSLIAMIPGFALIEREMGPFDGSKWLKYFLQGVLFLSLFIDTVQLASDPLMIELSKEDSLRVIISTAAAILLYILNESSIRTQANKSAENQLKLSRDQKFKEELIGVMNYSIKVPLADIRTRLELIRAQTDDELPFEFAKILDDVQKTTKLLDKTIRAEQSSKEYDSFNLNTILGNLNAGYGEWVKFNLNEIDWTVEHPKLVLIALQSLVDYGISNSNKHVSFTTRSIGIHWAISLEFDGVGLTKKQMEIFDTPNLHSGVDPGLDIFLASRILAREGMKTLVNSKITEGMSIVVMPVEVDADRFKRQGAFTKLMGEK